MYVIKFPMMVLMLPFNVLQMHLERVFKNARCMQQQNLNVMNVILSAYF